MNHKETQERTALMHQLAEEICKQIPGLSVEPMANVHHLADGSAFVECQLHVEAPDVVA